VSSLSFGGLGGKGCFGVGVVAACVVSTRPHERDQSQPQLAVYAPTHSTPGPGPRAPKRTMPRSLRSAHT
jgi:hypothetical protein